MAWAAHRVGLGIEPQEDAQGPTFHQPEVSPNAASALPAWACLLPAPLQDTGFLVGDQVISDFLGVSIAMLRRHAPDLGFIRRMGGLRITSLVAIEFWLREPLMPKQVSRPIAAKGGPGHPQQLARAVHSSAWASNGSGKCMGATWLPMNGKSCPVGGSVYPRLGCHIDIP